MSNHRVHAILNSRAAPAYDGNAPTRPWEFDHPLSFDGGELATKASMRGYEQLREIDYGRLARMALYKRACNYAARG